METNKIIEKLSTIMPKNEAKSELEFILMEHLGMSRMDLIMSPEKVTNYKEELNHIVELRINTRKPLQYILNKATFMGETFYVDKNVLIPRPETEILVDETSKHLNSTSKVLEIGTGSGCIPIMLAKILQNDTITSVDISEGALKVAQQNASKLCPERKINFIKSDLYENVLDRFDAIISNPPYIPYSLKSGMQPEVTEFEPHSALFAEHDGMLFYEKIISDANKYLKNDGFLAFEIGINQSEKIRNLLCFKGFQKVIIIPDLSSIDRTVLAWYN